MARTTRLPPSMTIATEPGAETRAAIAKPGAKTTAAGADTGPEAAAPAVATRTGAAPALGAAEARGVGLGMRLFFSAALLIAATVGAVVGIASWEADRLAAEEIRRTLKPVPDIFAGYVAAQGQSRRAQVRSLAEEVG